MIKPSIYVVYCTEQKERLLAYRHCDFGSLGYSFFFFFKSSFLIASCDVYETLARIKLLAV